MFYLLIIVIFLITDTSQPRVKNTQSSAILKKEHCVMNRFLVFGENKRMRLAHNACCQLLNVVRVQYGYGQIPYSSHYVE